MFDRLTVHEFFRRFPSDDARLDHLMEVRFGLRHDRRACGVEATFHRLSGRKAYVRSRCGRHVYPCAGTIFRDSRTSLRSWFYAIYLFVTARHGASGKEPERTLGVTYKAAWRMGQQIRTLMGKANGFERLFGHVELDEAHVGGRRPGGKRGRDAPGKTIVVGMAERGGRTAAEVIPDISKDTLREVTLRNVETGSTVSTDELVSHGLLEGDGYKHGVVKHGEKDFARSGYRTGENHHTNTVESFWKLFEVSVRSTHVHVSSEYMRRYLDEFSFRASRREMRNAMFDLLIAAV